MKDEKIGSRKVVLTKWMLVIFATVTYSYMILLAHVGSAPPESFFWSFSTGLGLIGGAFAWGNVEEHKSRSNRMIQK